MTKMKIIGPYNSLGIICLWAAYEETFGTESI